MEDNDQKSNIIILFYLGEKENFSHFKITDIWAWDFSKLEYKHDYIQCLFPLNEASFYNPDAPILDLESIKYFRKNEILRDNLKRSLLTMLRFYGLTFNRSDKTIFIDKGDNYLARKSQWISYRNHNYLRLTRILKCLMILGLEKYAKSLYQCLSKIYLEEKKFIGETTFKYWQKAITN